MTLRPSFLAVVVWAAGTLSTGQAFASDLDIELAARVGGGAPNLLHGPNPLAVGVGARGGVVWRDQFYLGAAVTAYFGETAPEQVTTGSCNFSDSCPVTQVSANSVLYGIDTGYDFKLAHILTLRPGAGVGYMSVTTTSQPVGTVSGSHSVSGYLYVEPAMTVLVAIGQSFFVGVDGGALWLASDETASVVFTGHAQAGVTF